MCNSCCNEDCKKGTIALHIHFKNVLTTSSSSYLLKGAVVTTRSFSSILVFVLLLCTVFPAAQIGWPFNVMCGSAGETGNGQVCDFNDVGEATDSEDDSPQETPDGGVVSRVSVSDCKAGQFLAWMNKIPPSTLLAFRLFHPPTSPS